MFKTYFPNIIFIPSACSWSFHFHFFLSLNFYRFSLPFNFLTLICAIFFLPFSLSYTSLCLSHFSSQISLCSFGCKWKMTQNFKLMLKSATENYIKDTIKTQLVTVTLNGIQRSDLKKIHNPFLLRRSNNKKYDRCIFITVHRKGSSVP